MPLHGYMGIVDAIERVMGAAASAAGEDRNERLPAPELAADRAGSWLGPAPGPVASLAQAPSSAVVPGPAPANAAQPVQAQARGAQGPIGVTVEALEPVGGETRIRQSFVLHHPRDAVWRLMSDVTALARCMPGLTLDGPPIGDKVAGRLEAGIGPIRASFSGEGTWRQFPSDFRQVVSGSGGDRRSGSRAAGSVDFRLAAVAEEAGKATRVDVVIGYVLAGPLAQIGRAGLVRDLVRRIGEAMAQNLDAQLRDPERIMPPARLGGLSLICKVLADRLRALLPRPFRAPR